MSGKPESEATEKDSAHALQGSGQDINLRSRLMTQQQYSYTNLSQRLTPASSMSYT